MLFGCSFINHITTGLMVINNNSSILALLSNKSFHGMTEIKIYKKIHGKELDIT